MLQKLSISNFTIIRSLSFTPGSKLNIITGETGAGKSIILDAIDLILGSRADIKTQSGAFSDGAQPSKAIVEAEFLLNKKKFESIFRSMDVDFEAHTIIRREITTAGKTRTFINDTPVSLIQLRTLGEQIVSIHSQNENSQLTDRDFQFSLIDNYAAIKDELAAYRLQYRQLRQNETILKSLLQQQSDLLKEKDYLEFLLNEFESAALQPNEEESLEQELNLLTNADNIVQVADLMISAISEDENSIADTLTQIKNRLKQLENVSVLGRELYERLNSAIIELKDIAAEAGTLRESVSSDGGRLEVVNERLNMIQNLKRKHGATDFADLLKAHEDIADKLLNIGNIDQEVEKIRLQNEAILANLKKMSGKLHQARIKASGKLKTEIESLLKELEMPNAKIEFELSDSGKYDEYGATELQLKFTANLGMPLQALNKVASGGELSRLALCIRSIEATSTNLGTLIFDEIDTGVSGKVAATIGKMMKQLSAHHQVIAITHLPQVAGYGEEHFMVCKKEENNSTVSYLRHLNKEERVEELAKMLSGNHTSESAKKNAQELLKV
jgi:DNA repair protein RecN (Recombination protein N)